MYGHTPSIHDIHIESRWVALEICQVFVDSIDFKQQIFCLFLWIGDGESQYFSSFVDAINL